MEISNNQWILKGMKDFLSSLLRKEKKNLESQKQGFNSF